MLTLVTYLRHTNLRSHTRVSIRSSWWVWLWAPFYVNNRLSHL